uniref:TMF_TATA_bd domain-containing protein n=1 Tax=Panagrellus redivivus TaxID=6233 RepID=A0A7E4USJ4_PANRE
MPSGGRHSIQNVAAAPPAVIHENGYQQFHQRPSPALSQVSQVQQQSAEQIEALNKQLAEATAANAALQAELEAVKAAQATSQSNASSIMGLLHAVEDISTVPPPPEAEAIHHHDEVEEQLAGLISPEIVAVEAYRTLESENIHLREANTGLNRDLETVRDKVAKMEVFAGNVETVKDRLEQERASIEEECERLREKLIERENELAKAKAQGEVSASTSSDWKTEISRLKGENTALVDAKDELLQKVQTLESLLSDVIEQKRVVEDRLSELEQQNDNLTQSNERLLRFEKENNRLDELDRLEQERASIEEECERLREKLIERENELAKAKAQGEVSASTSSDWKTEISRLKGENTALVDAKDELLQKVQTLESLLSDVIEQKRVVEDRLSELEQQNDNLTQSNERLLRFEKENNRLDELVNKMRTEVEQFRVEAELSRRCLDDLRRMIDRANSNDSLGSPA